MLTASQLQAGHSKESDTNYKFCSKNASLCTFSFLVVDIRIKYFSSYLIKTIKHKKFNAIIILCHY